MQAHYGNKGFLRRSDVGKLRSKEIIEEFLQY